MNCEILWASALSAKTSMRWGGMLCEEHLCSMEDPSTDAGLCFASDSGK